MYGLRLELERSGMTLLEDGVAILLSYFEWRKVGSDCPGSDVVVDGCASTTKSEFDRELPFNPEDYTADTCTTKKCAACSEW